MFTPARLVYKDRAPEGKKAEVKSTPSSVDTPSGGKSLEDLAARGTAAVERGERRMDRVLKEGNKALGDKSDFGRNVIAKKVENGVILGEMPKAFIALAHTGNNQGNLLRESPELRGEVDRANRAVEGAVADALANITGDSGLGNMDVFESIYSGIRLTPKQLSDGAKITVNPDTLALEVRSNPNSHAPDVSYQPVREGFVDHTEGVTRMPTPTVLAYLDSHQDIAVASREKEVSDDSVLFIPKIDLSPKEYAAYTRLKGVKRESDGTLKEGHLILSFIEANGGKKLVAEFKKDYAKASRDGELRTGSQIEDFQDAWCRQNIGENFDLYASIARMQQKLEVPSIHVVRKPAGKPGENVDFFISGLGHQVAAQFNLPKPATPEEIRRIYDIDPTNMDWGDHKGDRVIFNPKDGGDIVFIGKNSKLFAFYPRAENPEVQTYIASLQRGERPEAKPRITPTHREKTTDTAIASAPEKKDDADELLDDF
ncbi:MAG: hypothetical protein AAB592_05025 [Patescibacteria group bacterium]